MAAMWDVSDFTHEEQNEGQAPSRDSNSREGGVEYMHWPAGIWLTCLYGTEPPTGTKNRPRF